MCIKDSCHDLGSPFYLTIAFKIVCLIVRQRYYLQWKEKKSGTKNSNECPEAIAIALSCSGGTFLFFNRQLRYQWLFVGVGCGGDRFAYKKLIVRITFYTITLSTLLSHSIFCHSIRYVNHYNKNILGPDTDPHNKILHL